MSLYPVHDFAPQTAWPCAFAGQCGQIDDDFDRATDQMAMRRAMIPLTDFQPVSVLRRIPPMGFPPLAPSAFAIGLLAFGRFMRRNTGVPYCVLRGLISCNETTVMSGHIIRAQLHVQLLYQLDLLP